MEAIPFVQVEPGSPAYELLAPQEDAQQNDSSLMLWEDFRSTLISRLQSLDSFTEGDLLRRELHSLRGMSGQFGLFLLEVFLYFWETRESDQLDCKDKAFYSAGALAIARRSMDALERAFPHLAGR